VLIAALSGRALAVAARKAGYAPLVADLFGDEDLCATAAKAARIPGNLTTGLVGQATRKTLARLATGKKCEGIVWGAGFEDRPELLANLARMWPILGNSAEVVGRAKDPYHLAGLCEALETAHPQIRETAPHKTTDWLRKTVGGSGGAHVQIASEDAASRGKTYYQRKVDGRSVSALFVANGEKTLMIGFTDQWSNPTRESPLRYGGALRPASINRRQKLALGQTVDRIGKALGLRGLNSVDFTIEDQSHWLIEINPRPGATLDIFDEASVPLFSMHVEACRGSLPERAPRYGGAAAAAILYATRRVEAFPKLDWPEWTADRQRAGTHVEVGEPICTVRAKARSRSLVRARVEERLGLVSALVEREGLCA
jgi:predicted ATP-grasp superfamily ATP-dependent carboligase